jgi:hypothetical protein
MGTDIHVSFQIRRGISSDDKNKVWEVIESPKDKTGCPVLFWRDYLSQALLAGVRNYWNLTPIAQPKGLPDDMPCGTGTVYPAIGTPEFNAHITSLYYGYILGKFPGTTYHRYEPWLGEHDFSWLTLKELVSYNWKQTVTDKTDGENYDLRESYVHKVLIPQLKRIAAIYQVGQSDVRIVFGFDS